MKIENFQLRVNNSVCAGAFQLLRGLAAAQLRGNVAAGPLSLLRAVILGRACFTMDFPN
jgi:hypothetical protein